MEICRKIVSFQKMMSFINAEKGRIFLYCNLVLCLLLIIGELVVIYLKCLFGKAVVSSILEKKCPFLWLFQF